PAAAPTIRVAPAIRDYRGRIDQRLYQVEKTEAIGNFASGLAHEFNNLLDVIIANLGLAREHAGGDEELRDIVGEALEAAWRGAELTRRLLALARRQELRPARIEINPMLADRVELLRRLLGSDIELVLDLATTLWPVNADLGQLEASLASLAQNAREAMTSG